jgi:hypothetical protein
MTKLRSKGLSRDATVTSIQVLLKDAWVHSENYAMNCTVSLNIQVSFMTVNCMS